MNILMPDIAVAEGQVEARTISGLVQLTLNRKVQLHGQIRCDVRMSG